MINRLRALFQKAQPKENDLLGVLHEGADYGAIHDGVDYRLPVAISRQQESAFTEGQRAQYLQEYTQRDTFRFGFDSPYRNAGDLPFQPVTEDPLREWNWTTREYVLTNTHAAYQRNPIAKRGVNYVASFVVGEGFNLVCKNKEVEKVLQDFIDNPENAVREYERQAVIDLLVDGELVTRFFQQDGRVIIAPQRPWELQWIRTEKGFFRRPEVYHFQRYLTYGDEWTTGQETEIEDVPADDILFVAINRHGYELRGKPELYTILPWLRAYKEWLENRARQNHWRNALLWWVKVKTASQNVLAAVAARYRKPPTPGSVAVTTDNEEIQAVQNNVGAGEASEDGRQIKLMNAVGLGLPEYFLGDGSNANLASATRQQMPALTTFSDYQRIMTLQYWKPVMRRVLQVAIDEGLLPEEVEEQDVDGEIVYEQPENEPDDTDDIPKTTTATPPMNGNGARANGGMIPGMKPEPQGEVKMCPTLDAFDINYEPLQQTDITNIAQAMNMALQNDLVSKESASREMGFDYSVERKRMTKEREETLGAMMRGEIPIPMGMGMPGQPPVPPPDDEEAEKKPNVQPTTA